jgi:hypothetical protein
VDGVSYEIDLSVENGEALCKEFERYLQAGR